MRCRSALARSARILAVILSTLAGACTASAQSAPRSAPPQAQHFVAAPNLNPHLDTSTPQVAVPQFSVAPGAYSSAQSVTITCSTPGATIYYTTDGTDPSIYSTVYSGPVSISRSTTLAAIATASGYSNSLENIGAYYITSVPDSFLYTVAGNYSGGYSGDNGPATMAQISARGTAVDASGNIYIADPSYGVVRRVDASTGIITTIAGTGTPGYSGDNGPATSAQLTGPISLAFDSAGDLFIGDGMGVVREIAMSTGTITTYAGNTSATALGDNGPATAARLTGLQGIAFDSAGNLYIAQFQRVRMVAAGTQIITTVAGGGNQPYGQWGDGSPATNAVLISPQAVALDSSSNLYIVDQQLNSVREVNASTGIITTVAGMTSYFNGFTGDGGPATAAKLNWPSALALDSAGDIYIGDTDNWRIRKVDASTGIINTVAGNGACESAIEDGAQAIAGGVCFTNGYSFDKHGDLFFAYLGNVMELTRLGTPPSNPTAVPTLSLAAGTYANSQSVSISDSTPGAVIHVYINPKTVENLGQLELDTAGIAYRRPIPVDGSLSIGAIAVAPGYIPSPATQSAYTITTPPTSVVQTVAGTDTPGFSGAGGPAISANLGQPSAIASDAAGDLFIADVSNNVVWRVDAASAIISIYAGNGTIGTGTAYGDNGPATSASLYYPDGLAVDAAGNVYISDQQHYEVREVLANSGIIVRYAGNGLHGTSGGNGDGGPATSAFVPGPGALALDPQGNLYIIADAIREVSASTGIIQTVAGGQQNTTLGDGGPATSALVQAGSIAIDSSSNLYLAGSGRIRFVNAKTGIINTIAGDGISRSDGDGLPATQAEIEPDGITVDTNGNIYIEDSDQFIREIKAITGVITRVAGMDFEGYSGDGGSPLAATMCPAYGLAMDGAGNLYFPDVCGFTVRKITFNAPAPAPTFDPPAGIYSGPQSVTISDTAPNAAIYYTTDGSTPTDKSTLYNGAIAVTGSETINAIALAASYGQSPVGSAAYLFQTTPTITWAAPAAITYGTALSATQLNATASVPGAFVYSPVLGAVLPAGSQTLSVTFTPTDTTDYATATDSVMLTVNPATPAVALASSANPSVVAQSVTFTATVSSPAGTPAGSVTFYDGTASLGSGTLAAGVATYATAALAAGAHSITAQYSGDANFAPVTSAALAQTVNTFGIGPASGAPTTASGSPGSIATFVLSVIPPASSPVSFSVTGLPGGFSPSFSPNTVAAGAGATQVELTINIPAQAASAAVPPKPGSASRLPLAFGLVLLPLLGLGRRIRRSRFLLLGLLAISGIVASAALSGCSHNFTSGSTGNPTPSGTYTLTVTATAGTQTQSTTLTLNVQ